ncbi:hypothetical protein ACFOEE_04170 [Pseudoalteromonas fenneropenaei]|uniref:Lipoprotein n=1 Tax=Pseudoalteromonas fenneropenaei TaxID=1737459 RepID=A0ABV7CGJ0_9GAMM
MKQMIAFVIMMMSALVLTACEDAKEVKEQAVSTEAKVKQAWQEAVDEVKAHSENWNDKSVQKLLDDAKSLANNAATEGQDKLSELLAESRELAEDAWQESQHQAGELSEEAQEKLAELEAKIAEVKAKLAQK